MKNVKQLVIFLALFLCALALSTMSTFAANFPLSKEDPEHCYHSGVFDFNEETMTLDDSYVGNTIEWLMEDVE